MPGSQIDSALLGTQAPALVRQREPLQNQRHPRRKGAGESLERPIKQTNSQTKGLGQAPYELQPVFRDSPYTAEVLKIANKGGAARLLFVDEGNCCRSVVAEAMFKKVMANLDFSGARLDVHVESASLGPPFPEHDARVSRLAREAGLQLQPRTQRCFDEIQDMVNYDLVLVMDKFDQEEVLREVSVLDTINPGGFYTAKVRQLGIFAAASSYFTPKRAPWALGEGIQDPLYGNVGGEQEAANLWGTLRKLRLSCAGLAQFLVQLQARSEEGTALKESLFHALLCPLLGTSLPFTMQNSAWQPPLKDKAWRPVWQTRPSEANGKVYTLRKLNGRSFVVSKPSSPYQVKRRYWTDLNNLAGELKTWAMDQGHNPGLLPTSRELRGSGANQLCNAVEYHGGFHRVAQKLQLLPANRHTHGYWTESSLQKEITEFAEARAASSELPGVVMPTLQELTKHGRPDLRYAVLRFGGIRKVAKLAGLPKRIARRKSRA